MNFEKITETIKTENIEEQKEQIEGRISLLQIEYTKAVTEKEGTSFADTYDQLFGFRSRMKEEFKNRKKVKVLSNQEEEKISVEIDELMNEMDKIFSNENVDWAVQIFEEINRKKMSWGDELKNNKHEESNVESKYHKSLYYKIEDAQRNISFPKKTREAMKIEKVDKLLEIHFEDYFTVDDGQITKEKYKEILAALEGVAIHIKNNAQETRLVFGESWLLAKENLVKRLGFEYIDEEVRQDKHNTWLQFVDQKGQINEQRVKQLLETGEIPLKSRIAYMETEDFLRKYLPPTEKENPIILKELDLSSLNEYYKTVEEFEDLANKWTSFGTDDVEREISKRKKVNDLLEKAGVKDAYVELFKRMKEDGGTWNEAWHNYQNELKTLGDRIRERVGGINYNEKIVDFS